VIVELSKVPTSVPRQYWNFKNVMLWALLSGFVNTSDWPLCWRAHRKCLWLASIINASKTVNSHQWCSTPSAYTDTHGSVWKQVSIADQSLTDACFQNQTLPCAFKRSHVLIIVANHRHIRWARASTQWPIKGVYKSAQQCSKRHIF